MSTILSAKNIFKSFDKEKTEKLEILKGINFELEEGTITVIVGASGSGKSTLLHILSGIDRAESGEVTIKGENINLLNDEKISKFRNKNLGFIFQFHHLLPEFTALENVSIPQMINGVSFKKTISQSKKLLDVVGLSERYEHKPAELSGGEQQRVAVARALANNPKIVFADEPTGNLDEANRQTMHQLFLELKNKHKITLLLVTHNPDLVELADKVYILENGKLKERANK